MSLSLLPPNALIGLITFGRMVLLKSFFETFHTYCYFTSTISYYIRSSYGVFHFLLFNCKALLLSLTLNLNLESKFYMYMFYECTCF